MLVLGMSLASAQTVSADFFTYKVQKGERLSSFLASVLQLPEGAEKALQDLQKNNVGVDFHNLQPGQLIQVPKSWLQVQANYARVTQVQCSGSYWPNVSKPETKPLNVGDWVGEGYLLRMPPGCQVMLTLQDGSRIQMPSGAVMEITSLHTPKALGAPQVRLKLMEGRIGLDVFNKRPVDSVFEVQTPKTLAGVRGTQFRVGFDANTQNSRVEVLEGEVKNRGQGDANPSSLPKGTGQRVGATGAGNEPQILPPAPMFKNYQSASDNPRTGQLNFAAAPQAKSYAWRESVEVNQFSVGVEHSTSALHLTVPSMGSRAQTWYVSSVDSSGLQGLESTYALCHNEAPADASYCSVAFDTSSFNGRPMRLTLYHEHPSAGRSVALSTKGNGPEQGRLWVGALRPGQYRYDLSYLPVNGNPLNPDHWVYQTGLFQLINVHSGQF